MIEEIRETIKKWPSGKALGPDEFTCEFFNKFKICYCQIYCSVQLHYPEKDWTV
jgi:hypothetical protein